MQFQLLKEAYNYNKENFASNYILSNLLRSFAKDGYNVKVYSQIFGEDTKSFFKELKSKKILVEEISRFSGLLFEGYADIKLHEYFIRLDDKKIEIICEAEGILAKATNVWGKSKEFLKGLWEQFKGLGIVKTITPFLEKGFSWAKDLIGTGLGFFTQNISSLVVPAMLLFRTAPAAIQGINMIRKRKKMKPLSSEQVTKFKDLAKQKQGKISQDRKKVSVSR